MSFLSLTAGRPRRRFRRLRHELVVLMRICAAGLYRLAGPVVALAGGMMKLASWFNGRAHFLDQDHG